MADELTIFLCSLPDEEIPGTLRREWMRELFPDCRIVHFSEAIPEAGRGNPDAHRIWAEYIGRNMPYGVHRVFASEDYGDALAAALGARFVPLDVTRSSVPISGSLIRRQPKRYWEHLPVPVRAYYVERIAVVCSGDADRRLVHDAAHRWKTVWCSLPEDPEQADALLFAAGRQARRVLLVAVNPEQLPVAAGGLVHTCNAADLSQFLADMLQAFDNPGAQG